MLPEKTTEAKPMKFAKFIAATINNPVSVCDLTRKVRVRPNK